MSLEGKSALIITADLVDDLELSYARERLKEEGVAVTVVSLKGDPVACENGNNPVDVDGKFADVDCSTFDAIVLPGGFAPDQLRMSEAVLQAVRDFDSQEKPVSFICHAAWVPISAGILKGRRTTGYIAVKDDIVNAGGQYVDEPIVVDGNLIASRDPRDLGPWMKATIAALSN